MNTTTYSQARAHLKAIFDKAVNDSEPTTVTRKNGEDVIIISRSEYESLNETSYLLQSPVNKAHIESGLKNYQQEKFVEVDLDDL